MRIEFETQGEVSIVRLEGRFAAGSDAEYVRTRKRLKESGHSKAIVDCTAVPYVDSTALNFIVGLYTTMINSGGKLVLCGVTPRIGEVLRITHLDEIIPVFQDRATALSALVS